MAKKVPGEDDVFDLPFSAEFAEPDDFFDMADDAFEAPPVITEGGSRTIPHPITGKAHKSPRATHYAGGLADEFTLNAWKIAMVALGLGKREDLWALAASEASTPLGPVELREQGWWRPWEDIAHQAMDAAEASSGAHKGTAIHRWAENLDRGEITMDDIPNRFKPHLENYLRIHEESVLSVNKSYLETLVYTDKLHNGVNGRLDALRDGPGGWLVVDDLKTGRQAPMGLDEMAIQFAIYANAEWHIDPVTGMATPAPKNIRKDVAVVTWVPVDKPENAEIIPVDIRWGWQAAQVLTWVKRYLNRAKRKNAGLRLSLDVLNEIEPYRPMLKVLENGL